MEPPHTFTPSWSSPPTIPLGLPPHPLYSAPRTPHTPRPTPSSRSPPSTSPGAACAPRTAAAAQSAGQAVAAAVPGSPGTSEPPRTAALLPSDTVAAAARPMSSEPCGPPLVSLRASQRHPPPRTTCRVVKGMHGVTKELPGSYLSNSCPRRTPPCTTCRGGASLFFLSLAIDYYMTPIANPGITPLAHLTLTNVAPSSRANLEQYTLRSGLSKYTDVTGCGTAAEDGIAADEAGREAAAALASS